MIKILFFFLIFFTTSAFASQAGLIQLGGAGAPDATSISRDGTTRTPTADMDWNGFDLFNMSDILRGDVVAGPAPDLIIKGSSPGDNTQAGHVILQAGGPPGTPGGGAYVNDGFVQFNGADGSQVAFVAYEPLHASYVFRFRPRPFDSYIFGNASGNTTISGEGLVNLNIGGSLFYGADGTAWFPWTTDVRDLGKIGPNRRWRNLYLSGDVIQDGTPLADQGFHVYVIKMKNALAQMDLDTGITLTTYSANFNVDQAYLWVDDFNNLLAQMDLDTGIAQTNWVTNFTITDPATMRDTFNSLMQAMDLDTGIADLTYCTNHCF